MNIASLCDYTHRSSLRAVKRSVELASRLNALYLTLHCGSFSRDYPPSIFSRAWERSRRSVVKLGEYASELGVTLGLENKEKAKDRSILVSPQEFASFMRELGEGVGVVYDVGHANTWGLTAKDHINFISSLSGRLVAFHVHDNDGTADQHLAIGEGKIDFGALIPHMRSWGVPVTLEVHSLDGLLKSKIRLEKAL
ncbi:MAG: sugar phosphate isomerase/epimerase [Candidatus Freyarchaeota archaeon]|nr:sugar phosphate isomerase/epimerase [Candidatus Jordarchaeia archaeon]